MLGSQQESHRASMPSDRSVQIGPLAADLHVRSVDPDQTRMRASVTSFAARGGLMAPRLALKSRVVSATLILSQGKLRPSWAPE